MAAPFSLRIATAPPPEPAKTAGQARSDGGRYASAGGAEAPSRPNGQAPRRPLSRQRRCRGPFLVAICAIVALQVAANAADVIAAWVIGRPLGLIVPSYAELAGFFLAAASFLALPHALRCGAHIRVTSLIDRLGERARTAAEVWCAAAGAALSGYFTWYSGLLVAESVRYGDLSPGIVPVPLWIPQLAISVGLAVLTIAFVDRVVSMLAGVWPGDEPDITAPAADR